MRLPNGDSLIPLSPMRVWRTYRGGALIDRIHQVSPALDGDYPEEWIASTVEARNPQSDSARNGYTRLAEFPDRSLAELIALNPEQMVGDRHLKRYGTNLAVLTKLIDTVERLSIQVHPTRTTARQLFDSAWGKTEAWYVLTGRCVNGESPHVYLGFKPGITREKWITLFERQAIGGMIDALHRVDVSPGEVYLVEGGVPHAIGPGCFLVEVQEPTDYTIRVERTDAAGRRLPDTLCHQGAGFEAMFDCFAFIGESDIQTRERWRIEPQLSGAIPGCSLTLLIGPPETTYFSLYLLRATAPVSITVGRSFAAVLVLSGEGTTVSGGRRISYGRGDSFFLPAGIESVAWFPSGEESSEILFSVPPGANNDEVAIRRCDTA